VFVQREQDLKLAAIMVGVARESASIAVPATIGSAMPQGAIALESLGMPTSMRRGDLEGLVAGRMLSST
jgi:hypothetical protein